MEILEKGYEGDERRRKQRRIGFGRRVFRDRREGERRFDVSDTHVVVENRVNGDRRKAGRRKFTKRRLTPDRRLARVARDEPQIIVATETAPL